MRRAGRVDAGQQEIVKSLRDAGITVAVTSSVGSGFPDLVCGWRGINVLIELKDGRKVASAKKLTADERGFHAKWGGHVCVAESAKEAIEQVVAYARQMGKI